MKIIVSIKQVPDTSGKVAVNPDGTLNRAPMQTITNPDDMNALEAALKIKDATGCKVTVVTMGPPPAAGMLREALAMGADEAYLVSAREFGGSGLCYAFSSQPQFTPFLTSSNAFSISSDGFFVQRLTIMISIRPVSYTHLVRTHHIKIGSISISAATATIMTDFGMRAGRVTLTLLS